VAHDIVHAFVTDVSLSSVKRSSAPVLAILGVNDSPRRYDSKVMLTSIRSESGTLSGAVPLVTVRIMASRQVQGGPSASLALQYRARKQRRSGPGAVMCDLEESPITPVGPGACLAVDAALACGRDSEAEPQTLPCCTASARRSGAQRSDALACPGSASAWQTRTKSNSP